jgi:putative glutamine amidotransferase
MVNGPAFHFSHFRIKVSSMRRPIIGLTMDAGERPDRYDLSSYYASAVEKAGGMPFPIPFRTDPALIPQIVDLMSGIVFIGGNDLDPALYNQTLHPQAQPLNKARQDFELALMAEVERRRMPALGTCLGHQMMNVYRGGSLYQFLPELPRDNPIEHRKLDRDQPRHPIQLNRDSVLGRVIGKTEFLGNTSHKQAINRLGRGLRVIATAPDGVIEAFEDPSMPLFIGVQWHPERLHEEPEHLAIFKLLVDKASA